MKSFKDFLGPEATKKQDSTEVKRQKGHLTDKAKEYYDQGAREGGGGAAIAKGITMDLAKKNIKEKTELNEKGRCWTDYKPVPGKKPFSPGSCEKVSEEGEGGVPTNNVSGGNIAGSGGKGGEPGVSKKRNPLMSFFKRKQPKM